MHVDGRQIGLALAATASLIAILVGVASRAGAGVPPVTKKTEAPAVTKTVMVVGDSVPKSFADEFAGLAAERGYGFVSAARGGCPATGVAKVSSAGVTRIPSCAPAVVIEQDAVVAKYRPALVIWWSRYELAPRLGPDGKVLPLGSRAWVRAQQASFAKRASALTTLGARLVAVEIEPPGPALAARNPPEKYFLVGQTLLHRKDVVRAWNVFLASHKGPDVFSISIKHLICRDARSPCDDRLSNGESARPDGVHFSTTAQRLLAPLIFDRVWRAASFEAAPAQ